MMYSWGWGMGGSELAGSDRSQAFPLMHPLPATTHEPLACSASAAGLKGQERRPFSPGARGGQTSITPVAPGKMVTWLRLRNLPEGRHPSEPVHDGGTSIRRRN